MYTVEEVADQLKVSKVTIYSKLKKFNDMVVLKQGKKYITEELINLIKNDLKFKDIENNSLNIDIEGNSSNAEIAMDKADLINLNKDLINALIEQLSIKDKQLEEKDRQIEELHKLIENNQVLLKQEKEVNQLQLQEHLKDFDFKLNDVKEKMEQRRQEQQHDERKGFFKRIFKS